MNIAIVNCFDTYEHRVDLLYNFFTSENHKVKVYTSNFKHIDKCKRKNEKKDFIYINTIKYKKNISVQRLLSHYKLSKDIFKRLSYQEIDLLWVLLPPNSFAKDAIALKKKNKGIKLIFDVIDLWPETMPMEGIEHTKIICQWKKMRDDYIYQADYVVTECNLFEKQLEGIVNKNRLSTIYLARKIKPFISKCNLMEKKMSLCYLGSINNIIDIDEICRIIQDLQKYVSVELHIMGDGEKKNAFISKAKHSGAEVIFYGKIYDSKVKQKIFDRCNFGLNIMKNSVMVGLTMKSIDYFEAGLPIINNIKGDTWELCNNLNLGINVDDLQQINTLDSLAMRKNARNFYEMNLGIESFNDKVKDVLNTIMKI